MRIRLHPTVEKKVNENRRALSANAEVNRALEEYYANKEAHRAALSRKKS